MVTVYLTAEAQDALIVEFSENGFPELCAEKWTEDIRLEPIEACMSIRCQKTGEGETYLKKERFFPPTINMSQSETITVADEDLESAHSEIDAFLDGELEVPGIPAEEESDWLRNTVLLFRLVIPYVRKHIEDGSFHEQDERGGLYLYCEEDEIRSRPVSGKDRPELVYARLSREGKLIEEAGRFYEDELFAEDKMKSTLKELEARPRYLNIEGIGEGLDWPPIILEGYQCGRLLLDGKIKRIDLGSRIVPVSFRRENLLWQHPNRAPAERIYVSVDTLMKLPEVEVPIKRIPKEIVHKGIVEVIDAAFTCIVEAEGANLKNTLLSLYTRFGLPMLSPVHAEAACVSEGAKAFLEGGTFAADGDGYLGDVSLALLLEYKKLLAVLIAVDWFGKHGKTEGDQAGLLVECEGETVTVRRVTGKQRPDLICSAPEAARILYRPYEKDEDCAEADTTETCSFRELTEISKDPAEILGGTRRNSDLEEEIKRGNPQAMKLRARRLLEGEPTSEDKKQALSLYEKAFALLPDDDDLEFEIFMLKMDVDNE